MLTNRLLRRDPMQEIKAHDQSILKLLGGAKFKVDYYQREYRWETKQVTELLDDLIGAFLENYTPTQERSAVQSYGHYFLGSIVTSMNEGEKFIIDGQQRLTSLTLLLIYLHRELEDAEDKREIANLIFSRHFGRNSFNLDVPERVECMQGLFDDVELDPEGQEESNANIILRFQDIEAKMSSGSTGRDSSNRDANSEQFDKSVLPYFADWLIEKVYLVEIAASSDADAYTIFETMNDRGLSLTPAEMLKGYLLANVTNMQDRNEATNDWKDRIAVLQELGKEEDADGIKAWLRSQYAQDLRERSRNAAPRDFERIGSEFHRWVRDKREDLGLRSSKDFSRFIREDFNFYGHWYQVIREAGQKLTPGLDAIYYNAGNDFTLQYTVLLAPLNKSDSTADIYKKLRIVSTYIDILIARRIWWFRGIDYSTMSYAMFLLTRNIRGKNTSDLLQYLLDDLKENKDEFDDRFWLDRNSRKVHYLLARITDYTETQSGMPSRYTDYIRRSGRYGYEIEHIWANHPERHEDDFDNHGGFRIYRNNIGGLLLLPKRFNASYGDMEYTEKLKHYFGQNLLAKSLNEMAYKNNPGFRQFIDSSGLPFKPHGEFKKADLDERQELYRQIAEQVWKPEALIRQAET